VFDGSTLRDPQRLPDGWVLRGEGVAHPAIDPSQAWLRSWGPPVLGGCPEGFSVVQGTPEAVGALPPEMGGQMPIETVDIGAPMLSMHSARELMACADVEFLVDALTGWYAAP
jgi:hypothetical protein